VAFVTPLEPKMPMVVVAMLPPDPVLCADVRMLAVSVAVLTPVIAVVLTPDVVTYSMVLFPCAGLVLLVSVMVSASETTLETLFALAFVVDLYRLDMFHCESELGGKVGKIPLVLPVVEKLVFGSAEVEMSGDVVETVAARLVSESVAVETFVEIA
jgi:hypothetical protein